MKKNSKKDTLNLFFSAFLVIAYIICAHFFSSFASTLSDTAAAVVNSIIYAVFGLLVFYATRVGDGNAIKRFSPATLIIMVLPSLYIIIASVAAGLPFHSAFVSSDGTSLSVITILACIALGYGIPYTFLSGYETEAEDEEKDAGSDEGAFLEGGLEADIAANAEDSNASDDSDDEEELEEEVWQQDSAEDTAEAEEEKEAEREEEQNGGSSEDE